MTRVHATSLRPLGPPDQPWSARALADPAPLAPPSLNRRLRRALVRELVRLRPAITRSAAACDAERYRKHFDSFAHTGVLLFHGLSGSPSLRQSYAAMPLCPGLVGLSGLQTDDPDRLSISFSQLADSNTTRPAAFLAGLIPGLVARVRRAGIGRDGGIPAALRVLDGTFLKLSRTVCPWLPGTSGHDGPGLRLQLVYAPALDLPEAHQLTTTRTNDRQALATWLDDPVQLAAWREQTLTLDLGYYGHARFVRLLAAGVHLVTRIHPQARVTVTAERPVQSALPATLPTGRIAVTSDAVITLGSPNNRRGAVLRNLRQVTAVVQPHRRVRGARADPVTYVLVTDRFDLAADEVVQLYLWRWEIELFFRWLKRVIGLAVRTLGHSRNAVELSIWLALVVHLLTVLIAHACGSRARSLTLLTQVRLVLSQLSLHDLGDLTDALTAYRQLALPGVPAAPT
jgi:hypothetical protein